MRWGGTFPPSLTTMHCNSWMADIKIYGFYYFLFSLIFLVGDKFYFVGDPRFNFFGDSIYPLLFGSVNNILILDFIIHIFYNRSIVKAIIIVHTFACPPRFWAVCILASSWSRWAISFFRLACTFPICSIMLLCRFLSAFSYYISKFIV
mgnify:CR=1 FL=1